MKRFATLSGASFVVGALLLYVWWSSSRPLDRAAADRLLQIAIADADNGRVDTARLHLARILADCPDHHRAREVQAAMFVNLRLPREASDAIAALPDNYLADRFDESLSLAKFMTSFGFLYEGETFLRRLQAIQPDNPIIRKELLRCLRISGENHAAAELLHQALRDQNRKVEISDLLMATAPRRLWTTDEDVKFMKRVGQRNDDPLTLLGYARREIEDGRPAAALNVLPRVLARRPDWQPALTLMALGNWQLGKDEEWRRVMSGWDPATLDDADAWFAWGVWERQHGNFESAARCFGEALQRDPKHVGASSQLVVVLRELELESEAVEWKVYAERLAQVEMNCIDYAGFKLKPDGLRTIADECELLGWHVESLAWHRFAKEQWPAIDWPMPAENTGSPASVVGKEDAWSPAPSALALRRYPLPHRLDSPSTVSPPADAVTVDASGWKLDDEAAELGIRFRFANGLDPQRRRAYMFEFVGPGIGVLDYDGDGWPDLHLTQGAPWPVRPEETSLRDELFRNRGDGTFASVAEAARLGEPGYSQGPAVGDLNGDGFPDVFVCNIGPNRCYRNNGDGTFTEITAETGLAADDWSLSAAWADFNDDGLPDLYVVNYLAGKVFEDNCVAADGRPVQCPPMRFPGANDRLYLNRGDGTFQDISAEAGIVLPDAKGMGIVVGRLSNSTRPGIFIANDTTANFLFSQQPEPSSIPRFEELGVVSGIAFGPQGNAESSMGVASGDVNGDGRLDLFVTNFLAETTNLYLQGPGGVFEDQANHFGLNSEGMLTEGWGAQFLDVDADGYLDLFVANGHLSEHGSKAGKMPPHLFRNAAGKKLHAVSSAAVGSYFSRQYLGRSVAVWDWNRDGREDLSVSHVSDPVAVLTNRTENAGHRLGLRLVGVRAARDPIGAQVTLTSGERTLVRELVGGDGYAASNERRLSFGLGPSSASVDIDVDWGGGVVQRFSKLAVDAEYVLVEGRPRATPVRRYDGAEVTEVQ